MEAHEVAEALEALLGEVTAAPEVAADLDAGWLADEDGHVSVVSFEGAGVLTRDAGLVLTLSDGSEFQVTVVQSRRG